MKGVLLCVTCILTARHTQNQAINVHHQTHAQVTHTQVIGHVSPILPTQHTNAETNNDAGKLQELQSKPPQLDMNVQNPQNPQNALLPQNLPHLPHLPQHHSKLLPDHLQYHPHHPQQHLHHPQHLPHYHVYLPHVVGRLPQRIPEHLLQHPPQHFPQHPPQHLPQHPPQHLPHPPPYLPEQNHSMPCKDPRKEFLLCGNPCEKSCKFLMGDPSCPPFSQCKTGCFCKNEFVLNSHGDCIRPHCCPQFTDCGPDREFDVCGPACPPSCSTLNITRPCLFECRKGCFCKSPNVEDKFGNCVNPCDCPKPECSDPNREFDFCRKNWPKTCTDIDKADIPVVDNCIYGCFCKEGYVEGAKEKCISEAECKWMKSMSRWYS